MHNMFVSECHSPMVIVHARGRSAELLGKECVNPFRILNDTVYEACRPISVCLGGTNTCVGNNTGFLPLPTCYSMECLLFGIASTPRSGCKGLKRRREPDQNRLIVLGNPIHSGPPGRCSFDTAIPQALQYVLRSNDQKEIH